MGMTVEARSLGGLRGVRHGFLDRRGGVSDGPFASLNLGLRGGDDPDRVARNRAIAAERLGFGPDRLALVRQVHGKRCQYVATPADAAEVEADALVTDQPGLLLGVLTADCAPVLLVEPQARIVAAAHAGWRGALSGVIETTVGWMVALGAEPARVRAAVGPCIGQDSYEVGPELEAEFRAEHAAAASFFERPSADARPYFDLAGYCAWRLERAGIVAVETTGQDTCADAQRWFSNRRASKSGDPRFGVQLSAIALV